MADLQITTTEVLLQPKASHLTGSKTQNRSWVLSETDQSRYQMETPEGNLERPHQVEHKALNSSPTTCSKCRAPALSTGSVSSTTSTTGTTNTTGNKLNPLKSQVHKQIHQPKISPNQMEFLDLGAHQLTKDLQVLAYLEEVLWILRLSITHKFTSSKTHRRSSHRQALTELNTQKVSS